RTGDVGLIPLIETVEAAVAVPGLPTAVVRPLLDDVLVPFDAAVVLGLVFRTAMGPPGVLRVVGGDWLAAWACGAAPWATISTPSASTELPLLVWLLRRTFSVPLPIEKVPSSSHPTPP